MCLIGTTTHSGQKQFVKVRVQAQLLLTGIGLPEQSQETLKQKLKAPTNKQFQEMNTIGITKNIHPDQMFNGMSRAEKPPSEAIIMPTTRGQIMCIETIRLNRFLALSDQTPKYCPIIWKSQKLR